jgi:hypothetical protein
LIVGRAAVLGVALGVLLVPAMAVDGPGGTTTKVAKPRTIMGVVLSKSGAPIQGAVVYLKDTRSLAVKSFLSDTGGQFHFRQLSMTADYDLWAELHGDRSKIRHISQFNSKPDLNYTLKVDTGK